jgi:hypothetical protein
MPGDPEYDQPSRSQNPAFLTTPTRNTQEASLKDARYEPYMNKSANRNDIDMLPSQRQ